MPRNRPQLERASLAQAVTTALHRSRFPVPTADVVAAVVNILGLGDRSLGLAVVQVRRCLRHMEGRGVLMTGSRGKRLWHVAQDD